MTPYDQKALRRLLNLVYIDPETGCWKYTGYTNPSGYGVFSYGGKPELAHRVSLHIHTGFDLSGKLDALHKTICKCKRCCNPDHLYAGDEGDNHRDFQSTITHCPQGHKYTSENSIISGNRRRCKICHHKIAEDCRKKRRSRLKEASLG